MSAALPRGMQGCVGIGLAVLCAAEPVAAQPAAPAPSRVSIATVSDVATDRVGRVYIADDRSGAIHILSRDLQPVAAVGRRGRSGGEFEDLRAVRVIDDSTFVTVERYLRRIDFWTWRGATPQLARSMTVPFEPYDACPLPGRRLLVVGLYENHRVHEVDAGGRVLRSLIPSDSGLVLPIASRIARGFIACTANGEAVLTSTGIPRVELFQVGSAASPPRQLFLAPFRAMEMEARGGGASFRSLDIGFHAAGRAIRLGESWLAVARIIGRRDGVPGDSARWYAMDTRQARVAKHVEAEGRLFPLGGDRALQVIETTAGVNLVVGSFAKWGFAPASPQD
jgi:hypothetical protein